MLDSGDPHFSGRFHARATASLGDWSCTSLAVAKCQPWFYLRLAPRRGTMALLGYPREHMVSRETCWRQRRTQPNPADTYPRTRGRMAQPSREFAFENLIWVPLDKSEGVVKRYFSWAVREHRGFARRLRTKHTGELASDHFPVEAIAPPTIDST